ncbi:MAG: hypothetical protein P8Z40_13380 [Chloroflexota bacterium]
MAAVGALIMLATSVPYIIGMVSETADMRFGGFLFGVYDINSYVAKMRYGAYDGWLLRLVYTHEAHQGGFVYTYYLALGKLAALLSGGGPRLSTSILIAAYHAARIVCGLLLLGVMYRFMAEFLDRAAGRRLAWIIAAIMGGLGWTLFLVTAIDPTFKSQFNLEANAFATTPIELYLPESATFLILYGFPHLAFARALLLTGWLLFFGARERKSWKLALAAGLAWLGMGLIVPFYGALLGVQIGAWLVGLWIVEKRLPVEAFFHAVLAGVPPGAVVLYNAWLFTANPVFAGWGAQNVLNAPPPLDLLLAYIALIGLSIPALVGLFQEGLTEKTLLLVVWPLVAALMVYLPTNVQRRLLEGVIVPLSILAAMGVGKLVGGEASRIKRLLVGGLLALLLPSTAILLGGGAIAASNPAPPIFHPTDELAALDWLRREALIGGLVFSTFESGNDIPMYAGVRVYAGHSVETNDFAEKSEVALGFYEDGLTDGARRDLLEEVGAEYLWIGPPEREAMCDTTGCFDPARLGLVEVYRQGEYMIYKVGE